MNYKRDIFSAERLLSYLSSRKIILLITVLLGLPSLAFSSYVFSSRIPFSLIDPISVANFFSSFYLAAIFSLAAARVITFFIEFFYRTFQVMYVLSRKRKKSKIYHQMTSEAEKVEKLDSLTLEELSKASKVLFKYERYVFRSRDLADGYTSRIFSGINSYYFIVPISYMVFSYLFGGTKVAFLAYFVFMFIPYFMGVSMSSAEYHKHGLMRAAIGRATFDFLEKEGVSLETKLSIREKPEAGKRSQILFRSGNFFKNFGITLRDDTAMTINILKNDMRLLAIVFILSGIVFGVLKYNDDLELKVKMVADNNLVECVSPLLLTANHMILYSHSEKEIVFIPYEGARYHKGEACTLEDKISE